MLTPFDDAVIAYAHSRGEPSELVYERIDRLEPHTYRDQQTEAQLLAKLERVKANDLPRVLIIEEKETEEDLKKKRDLFQTVLDSRASLRRSHFLKSKKTGQGS